MSDTSKPSGPSALGDTHYGPDDRLNATMASTVVRVADARLDASVRRHDRTLSVRLAAGEADLTFHVPEALRDQYADALEALAKQMRTT